MEITEKLRPRLPTGVAQFLLGIAGLALITIVCFPLEFGVARTGFAYVILIALLSLLGSFSASIILSVVAAACLNYFFAPPLFEIRIDAADDIVRIAAFLTTSLVVAALTTRVRTSEVRYRTFVDHASDGFFLIDEHQAIRDVNRQACESLGYSRDEMIGMNPRDFDAGLDAAAIARIGERVTAGETVTFESLHRRKDGSTFPVEVRVRQFRQGPHRLRLSLAHDITARKRAQDVLRDSEARLQKAQHIAHFGWWERDFSTNHVSLSDEVCRIFGLQPVELPEWHGRWLNLIHPEDRPSVADAAAAALARDGPRYEVEYRVVRPDGGERVVHSQGDVAWDDAGRPLRQFGVLQDITELRRAEHELRASEARFRTFVNHATDAFFLLDDHSTIIDVNREACDTLGYTRDELIGRHRSDFDVGLDEATIARIRQRVFARETVTFETRHRRKDGSSFPVEIRQGHFEQDGHRFLCLARDITERKRAEAELRASEARFRTFVDYATDAFFLLDDQSTIVDVNREACDSLGYSRDELIGMHHSDLDVGLDEASIAGLRQRIAAGETVTFETRHRRKDGTSFPVEIRAGQLEQGGQRFLCLVRDITERKRAEDELRESEERFRTLMQFSFDVYWESDAQHRFTRQEFSERLGDARAPGSEIGKTRWEVPYAEPDAEAWRKHRETLDAHLPFRDFELARPTPDGGKRYVSVSGLPVFDKAGRFIGYRGVGRHITERKRVEEALRRSEAYLAEAQRLSHTGTMVLNAAGPVYLSEESYRIWGLDPGQNLPDRETLLQRIHRDDRERVNAQTQAALAEKRDYLLEFRIIRPDGTVRHLEATGHPLLPAKGDVEVLGTYVDVTDRKRAEEEHERLRQLESDLAHVNRLSIMGELAASLAHEILHPIATARNNARAGMRYLDQRPPNLDEVREALSCVVRDADRAKGIVDRMRDHIKKAPPRKEPVDVNEAIDEVIGMVQSAIDKNRIAVRTRLSEPLIPVEGDRVQLQQVVVNLILNAVEAMSGVENGARELSISTEPGEPGGIRVAVCDSGPGIDPEHLQRVFQPFYTTKTSGIGMGLSICRSIIDSHGGRLWAEANEPRGTAFRFTLPATQDDS
jgi:PAS domain S-box-containing protein